MEPDEIDAARQTLDQLVQRIERDVTDIKAVLTADIPRHVQRSVRSVFESSPAADDLSDAQVTALKVDTRSAGEALAAEVVDGLSGTETWLWPDAEPLPADAEGFDEHPRLREALARVPAAVQSLLERHGLPTDELEAGGAYRVPSYFVAGHFMKSLLADYWRAIGDHAALRAKLEEGGQAEARRARRDRWDQA